MKKYHILYVIDSSPKMQSFDSEKEVNQFLNKFIKEHKSLDDNNSNWVSHIFKGKELSIEGTYEWYEKVKGSIT